MNRVSEVTDEMVHLANDTLWVFLRKPENHLQPGMSFLAMRTALTAILPMLTAQASVPDGWKLVPIEPTDEMSLAARHASLSRRTTYEDIYAGMLSAAPQHEVTK